MSDKFFFKGRQNARQDHKTSGFRAKASQKIGSKKYPMALVVTNNERMQEVEALVAKAELYAEITIDNSEGAVESIGPLTLALSKVSTVKVEKMPDRNQPCHCGSGNKFKKCCG